MLLGVLRANLFSATFPRFEAAAIVLLHFANTVRLVTAVGYLALVSSRFIHFVLLMKTATYDVFIRIILYKLYFLLKFLSLKFWFLFFAQFLLIFLNLFINVFKRFT